jgi:hypothetical protein
MGAESSRGHSGMRASDEDKRIWFFFFTLDFYGT